MTLSSRGVSACSAPTDRWQVPVAVGPEERSWTFAPTAPWADAQHRLVVDPMLEDVAGNSVRRVFDRDLSSADDDPRDDGPVELPFHPT